MRWVPVAATPRKGNSTNEERSAVGEILETRGRHPRNILGSYNPNSPTCFLPVATKAPPLRFLPDPGCASRPAVPPSASALRPTGRLLSPPVSSNHPRSLVGHLLSAAQPAGRMFPIRIWQKLFGGDEILKGHLQLFLAC